MGRILGTVEGDPNGQNPSHWGPLLSAIVFVSTLLIHGVLRPEIFMSREARGPNLNCPSLVELKKNCKKADPESEELVDARCIWDALEADPYQLSECFTPKAGEQVFGLSEGTLVAVTITGVKAVMSDMDGSWSGTIEAGGDLEGRFLCTKDEAERYGFRKLEALRLDLTQTAKSGLLRQRLRSILSIRDSPYFDRAGSGKSALEAWQKDGQLFLQQRQVMIWEVMDGKLDTGGFVVTKVAETHPIYPPSHYFDGKKFRPLKGHFGFTEEAAQVYWTKEGLAFETRDCGDAFLELVTPTEIRMLARNSGHCP